MRAERSPVKLKSIINSISDEGDQLTVRGRGFAERQAEGTFSLPFEIRVPNTETSRRAFYVGREVHIEVSPK